MADDPKRGTPVYSQAKKFRLIHRLIVNAPKPVFVDNEIEHAEVDP